jgi:hypothetical protein
MYSNNSSNTTSGSTRLPSDYRILMFAPVFPPSSYSEAIVVGKLMLSLIRNDFEIDIITQNVLYQNIPYIDLPIWKPLECRSFAVPQRNIKKLSIFSKIAAFIITNHLINGLSWSYYAFRQACKLSENRNYDFIVSRSSPMYGHLPALSLRRKLQIPWIACWNDPEPLCRNPRPYGLGESAPVGFNQGRFLSAVIKEADWHVFPSERLLQYMGKMYSGIMGKASVIPHISLPDIIAPSLSNRDKFVLCHAGLLGGQRSPDNFLKGMSLFLDRHNCHDLVRLHLIGNNFSEQMSFYMPHNVKEIIYCTNWLNYTEALKIMAESSVSVIIEAPVDEGIYLPAKMADCVQCNRPILAISPKIGTLNDLLVKYGGGIAVDGTSCEAIADGLGVMYESWRKGLLEKEFVSEDLYLYFSEENILSLLEDIIKKICRKQK